MKEAHEDAKLELDGTSLRGEALLSLNPEAALAYVAELQHLECWWPEHWRYRRLSGDGGPGTRYGWIFVGMGAVLPGITRIERREPGLLEYRTSMVGVPIRMRYEFTPGEGGTRVRATMTSPGLRFRIFAWAVRRQLSPALGRLASASRRAASSS